jgi:recombinational DNA repair ATPase RecF
VEVSISHYKSIEKAQMKLGRVTVLLGPPAAGKSNVLEAIALATYFDRYAFYVDREPLSRLVRTDDVSDLFTFYDLTKTVEISIGTDEWRRSLRIYFQQGLRLNSTISKCQLRGFRNGVAGPLSLLTLTWQSYL